MQPLSGMEGRPSGEPLEDAGNLHLRADLEGPPPRESSASRREYEAQIRHRAAEDLRQMELRAQSEAEAAAEEAEAGAEAAQAEAAAATVKLAAGRMMMPLVGGLPPVAGWEVEEQVEHMRRAALREAAQQARRAAAERLEAARRAEAAALADSIARREEREIAESQASVLRQAAMYAEAEMRIRSKRYVQPEISRPWRGSGPYRSRLPFGGDGETRTATGEVRELRSGLMDTGAIFPEVIAPAPHRSNEPEFHAQDREAWRAAEHAPRGRGESMEEIAMPAFPRKKASVIRTEGVSYRVPEIVSRFTEGPLEDTCWCEAERLIGCGYSKLEGVRPRVREAGRGVDTVVSAPGPAGDTAADRSAFSRWKALRELLPHPNTEQARDRSRDGARSLAEAPRDMLPTIRRNAPFVVVYSQAGGTGRTSLVANLGRALASLGEKVLLAETTGQGLLPYYFGAADYKESLVRSFPPPGEGLGTPVELISYDVAARETNSGESERDVHAEIIQDVVARGRAADRVLIDLSVSCGWVVARMAWMNPTILVPLAPDMNSVVSLQSVERRFNVMQDAEGRPLAPVYLLNQFDASMALHRDVREALKRQLGDRLLPFVVRRADAVEEALAEGTTIVDYDRSSDVATDYFRVAEWLRNACVPAAPVLHSMGGSPGL